MQECMRDTHPFDDFSIESYIAGSVNCTQRLPIAHVHEVAVAFPFRYHLWLRSLFELQTAKKTVQTVEYHNLGFIPAVTAR